MNVQCWVHVQLETLELTREYLEHFQHRFPTIASRMTDAARWKATVYVGGLAPTVTVSTLHDAFIPFGDIADVSLPKNENPNSNATEPHRGFAYVEFEDENDAKEAMDNMDQAEFFGRIIKVTPAKAPKSADEGLGSKKALWAQVRLQRFPPVLFSFLRVHDTDYMSAHRKAGWQRMLSAKRTDWLQIRLRLEQSQDQRIQCKVSKDWMLRDLARLEFGLV